MDNNKHLIKFSNGTSNTVHLYQWDKGQVFEFEDTFAAGTEVQFSDGSVKVISNKQIEVPDAVLERFGLHKAWIQLIGTNDETTILNIFFDVEKRAKKNDYVEPDDEQTFREEVQTMVNAKQDKLTAGSNITIENNVISATGGGGTGTTDYTALTNKPSINNVTLTGNKSLADLGINIPSLSGYATQSWVEGKGYLTEHQSLANYYTKTEINSSFSQYSKTTEVSTMIANAIGGALNGSY